MSRVQPLPHRKFPVGARILDRVVARMYGQPFASTAIAAHSPSLVWGQSWMDRYVTGKRSVPRPLLELVCVRTAMELGCAFCIDLGSYVSTTEGITPEQLRALGDHAASDLFTDAEKAALDLAVAMAATPVAADDALYARLHEHFTERQIVDLTATAAWENHRSRFNVAVGLDAQGFSEPGACAVPTARPTSAGLARS